MTFILQLRLYAKFRSNGSDIEIPDKFEGKAILSTQTAIQEIYHKGNSIGTFFSLLFGIPFLLFPFVIIYAKGARTHIRNYLRDPKHHSSLAALVSISYIFNCFVFGMDIAALHFAYLTQNELTEYANFLPINFVVIPLILFIDTVVLLFATGIVLALIILHSCKQDTALTRCFRCILYGIFCGRKLSTDVDDYQNEQKVWLLTLVFVAPFTAFGTHFTYIVIAWTQYPGHATAISLTYTLTFVYLFVTLRFLYVCLSYNKIKCDCCKVDFNCWILGHCEASCCFCVEEDDIESPPTEIAREEENERGKFNMCKVVIMIIAGAFVCGFEVWFIAGLVTLPIVEVIDDAPTYIFALLQAMFVAITGLITWKVLAYKRSDDKRPKNTLLLDNIFLATMVKACKYMYAKGESNVESPSADTDVEKAAVLLSVLIKEHKKYPIEVNKKPNRPLSMNEQVDTRAEELWEKALAQNPPESSQQSSQ